MRRRGTAISSKNPHYADAAREAFVALQVARKQATQGNGQSVYLGDRAIRFLYGGSKDSGEQDCDVVGRVLQPDYGYWLAEGKGADILKAVKQFDIAKECIDRNPATGPVLGSFVAMSGLRYLQWIEKRRQSVAFKDQAINLPYQPVPGEYCQRASHIATR